MLGTLSRLYFRGLSFLILGRLPLRRIRSLVSRSFVSRLSLVRPRLPRGLFNFDLGPFSSRRRRKHAVARLTRGSYGKLCILLLLIALQPVITVVPRSFREIMYHIGLATLSTWARWIINFISSYDFRGESVYRKRL